MACAGGGEHDDPDAVGQPDVGLRDAGEGAGGGDVGGTGAESGGGGERHDPAGSGLFGVGLCCAGEGARSGDMGGAEATGGGGQGHECAAGVNHEDAAFETYRVRSTVFSCKLHSSMYG